eukprot:1042021-Pyramimonas_sp.AAC.1
MHSVSLLPSLAALTCPASSSSTLSPVGIFLRFDHIQSLQNLRLTELEQEVDKETDWEVKARLRSRLQRRRGLWRPLQKRISLGAILDSGGAPRSTIEEAGEELARHWET